LEEMSCCSVVSRMMNLFVIVYVHDYYDLCTTTTADRSSIVITPPAIHHHIHSIEIGAVLSSCPAAVLSFVVGSLSTCTYLSSSGTPVQRGA